MKYLSDYLNHDQSKLLEKNGVFFAFSNDQFNESKTGIPPYIHLGAGCYCPKVNVESYQKEYQDLIAKSIKKDLEENGVNAIVLRELDSYECYYTGDLDCCIDALSIYGITSDVIIKIYNQEQSKEKDEHREW